MQAQLSETQRYGNGSIRDTKVGFIARGVPAMGYAVYRVVPQRPGANGPSLPLERSRWHGGSSHQDTASIENEKYKLTFELWTGELLELRQKPMNWSVLGGQPGNVVAMEHDGGDFWELGGNLNGARLVAMQKKQALPSKDTAAFSSDTVAGNGRVTSGPVFSEFGIQHAFESSHFWSRVRIYSGIDRIDFQTRILNNEEFARYRVLFPTSIRNGVVTGEIPFGSIERPAELELPAQNWTDYGNAQRGVALLNRGLPGNNVVSDTLLLSLMRSSKILQYTFHGGFEPGVGSDSGLDLGKLLTFDYALLPHDGDWRQAGVHRAGWEFNTPLMARKLPVHEGELPQSFGLFSISHPNVVVSAVKNGPEGSVIVRLYEASGLATDDIRVDWNTTVRSAHMANLIEDPLSPAQAADNALRFDLGPYEIKTFRLQLDSPANR